ncbi:MAG: hypothetical protein Ct9H90mP18_06970 [Gammaproteobacteria bacterium]|nr:MAG: hypothetical protein Ct9H90mP18_06970 [Gammaproteobacteria bacterium]
MKIIGKQIPMLPVTREKTLRDYIFLVFILLLCISIFPYLLGFSGLIYFIGTLLIGFKFVYDAFLLMQTKSDIRAIQFSNIP